MSEVHEQSPIPVPAAGFRSGEYTIRLRRA
ncbi:hypothetical protein M2266_003466 [Streptomyces sp. SPB162]|nr:hypothetical protein [Streptomyces sp. SPB162]